MNLNVFLIIAIVSIFTITAVGQSAFGYGGPPENNSANNYTVDINTDQESYINYCSWTICLVQLTSMMKTVL